MKEFRPAKKRVEVSVGESVRILRELQELSQSQLSELTGIPQATISAIENGRVNLGVERAKTFARALNCHPAVLVFPGWEVPQSMPHNMVVERTVQGRSGSKRPQRSNSTARVRPIIIVSPFRLSPPCPQS